MLWLLPGIIAHNDVRNDSKRGPLLKHSIVDRRNGICFDRTVEKEKEDHESVRYLSVIIENCHCSFANLKIASNGGGSETGAHRKSSGVFNGPARSDRV